MWHIWFPKNLKCCLLLKDLEEKCIHQKKREHDNESIENYFLRSFLITITATINSTTPRKPHSRNGWKQLENCRGPKFITTGLTIILKKK